MNKLFLSLSQVLNLAVDFIAFMMYNVFINNPLH